MSELALSEDGYLLSKSVHKSKIKRVVDLDAIEWDVKFHYDPTKTPFENFKANGGDQENLTDEWLEWYAVRYLFRYEDRQADDIVVEFNDLGILAGAAGFLWLRDGYVQGSYITRRS